MNTDARQSPAPAVFATTHWSVVVQAGEVESPQTSEALAQLCNTYWYPLYVYVRRKGYAAHDAQDLTQEFFARLIEREGRMATSLLRMGAAPFFGQEMLQSSEEKRAELSFPPIHATQVISG